VNAHRRRLARAVAGAGLIALLGRAAPARAAADTGEGYVAPHYRPSAGSEESGLWSVLDRREHALGQSRFLLRTADPAAYCRRIVCRLVPAHCADLRVYVLRAPRVDVGVAPNGMLQVASGLLLRCGDEAQLAAILAHELAHFLRRHAVERWQSERSSFDVGTFFSLSLAVEGADAAGVLSLAAIRTAFPYTIEQEREADRIGLRLLTAAGYAAPAAPEIWERLVAEDRAAAAGDPGVLLFASHPDAQARLARLRELAAAAGDAGERGQRAYRQALAPVLPRLLDDELLLRRYARSLVVLDRLAAESPDDGAIWFAQGEVHRLRAGEGDAADALAAYRRALAARGTPPETYRSIGLVQLRTGARGDARRAFTEYLRLRPHAPDRDAVRALASA
jgi:predicted Zn-dependent protease